MKLSISNLAWEKADDAAIAAVLQDCGISTIDVVPGRYFPAPAQASLSEIHGVRQWWEARGISITGMQALLFGVESVNVFGDGRQRRRMLEHLSAVCRIARGLGATRLVFGSPRQRNRSGLDDATVKCVAGDFFRALGDIAASHGVLVCLEPNPPAYGANFMTTFTETMAVVSDIDHPAIRMQVDTGAMTLNGENPAESFAAAAPLVGHVHISEPHLVPLGEGDTNHGEAARALHRYLPDATAAIEMLPPQHAAAVATIERCLRMAQAVYGCKSERASP
jgi:D-psicose/D-tagatose/L-ribulose 3-epimerase